MAVFLPVVIDLLEVDQTLELDVLLEALVARIDSSVLAHAAIDLLDLRFDSEPRQVDKTGYLIALPEVVETAVVQMSALRNRVVAPEPVPQGSVETEKERP
jgi:hypothetical protein